MRIISGKYKGRKLNSKLPSGIRPTQDAVRETIFNILNNYIDFEELIVADICAGAGMLGIEALSRGAKYVYFIDKSKKAINFIQNNLKIINNEIIEYEANRYKLSNLDALQFINYYTYSMSANNAENNIINNLLFENKMLDLIFLDPPYQTNVVNEVLDILSTKQIISEGGTVVVETAIHNFIVIPECFEILAERQFGASKIIMIRYKVL